MSVVELRLIDVQVFGHAGTNIVPGIYPGAGVREQLLRVPSISCSHPASLLGGASEREAVLIASVNLHSSIALLNAVGGTPASIVGYASSIAALDRPTGL